MGPKHRNMTSTNPVPGDERLTHDLLPVDIVLHPSWWFAHAGITFDEDFSPLISSSERNHHHHV
jgi:hypothetical protein